MAFPVDDRMTNVKDYFYIRPGGKIKHNAWRHKSLFTAISSHCFENYGVVTTPTTSSEPLSQTV